MKIELSQKQLTVDFVNESVGDMSVDDQSDHTDFAERLGVMNNRFQVRKYMYLGLRHS